MSLSGEDGDDDDNDDDDDDDDDDYQVGGRDCELREHRLRGVSLRTERSDNDDDYDYDNNYDNDDEDEDYYSLLQQMRGEWTFQSVIHSES